VPVGATAVLPQLIVEAATAPTKIAQAQSRIAGCYHEVARAKIGRPAL
jgi:hypothetical protein